MIRITIRKIYIAITMIFLAVTISNANALIRTSYPSEAGPEILTILPEGCPNNYVDLSYFKVNGNSCPATVIVGVGFDIDYMFERTGDGVGGGAKYEHRSLWSDGVKLDNSWTDGDNGECAATDLPAGWTLVAGSLGTHTYEIKSYGSSISSEPSWEYVDDKISCEIIVLPNSGQCNTECVSRGFRKGECTINQDLYQCIEQGATDTCRTRQHAGDYNCGPTYECWCEFDQACDCSLPTAMCGKCSDNPGTCPDYNSVYLRNSPGSDGGGISSCLLGNNDAAPFCWEGQTCGVVDPDNWGEHAISGYSVSSTNACSDNNCLISAPYWNGKTCAVRKACSTGIVSSANGKWDDSEMKCVECSAISGKGEGKIFGDPSAIRIDCSGNPILGDWQCESACGADPLCDDKDIGNTCGSGKVCDNSCNCITPCDSSSYTTCAARDYMSNAESNANMCGAEQNYYTLISIPELVTWTITPSANVDYDLYTKKDSCPSASSFDSRTSGGVGIQESITACVPYGTSNALAHKSSGTGSYGISLSKTSVECCSNGLYTGDANPNNDRSSQCTDASKPRCDLISGSPTQYQCVTPAACNTNADCIPGQCCTYEIDTSKQGKCENVGTLSQPYLCA